MSEAGLFSGVGGGGAGGSAALALKCGRCVFAESTKENGTKCLVVTPQAAQKGALTIAAAGADGVVHLKWTHRETGAVEPDVMIFPNEWTFTAVDTGREKEIVWLLQLSKNSKRRHFFWSLESDADTAKDKAKALGKYLKEPSSIPAAGAGAAGAAGGGLPGGMSQAQLLQMLGGGGAGGASGIDPALLQQLMGGAGGGGGGAGGAGGASRSAAPSGTGAAAPAAPVAGGAVNGDDMRALLQSMQSAQGGDDVGSAAAGDGGDEDDMEAAMLAAAIAASLAGGNAAGSGGAGAEDSDADGGNADAGDSSNNDSASAAASSAAPAAPTATAPPALAAAAAPVTPTPAPTATGAAAAPAGDLNAMMAAILGGAAMQQQMQQQQQQVQPVIAPLSDLLSSNDVGPLLEDDAVVAALLPHLPEGQQTAEELRRTLSTPQFRSTLRTLTSALMSDNYNSVMANFGLDPTAGSEALAQGNPVLAFLQAVQAQAEPGPGASKN